MISLDDYEKFFNELCAEYYEKILKYVYFNIKDETYSRDITQNVFLIVYEKIEYVFKHPNIGGFIFQTAKNLVRQHKREIYNKLMMEINDEDIINVSYSTFEISDFLDKEINEFDYISDVLNMLTDEKRNLYNLYYIKRKPMEEIAYELGIGYSAVRMGYVRLRKEIRDLVKELAEKKF